MNLSSLCRAGAGPILFLIIVGCAAPETKPTVRGKVTFQGQPVTDQMVTLYWEAPEKHDSFFSRPMLLTSDGSFAGELPAAGTYKVIIQPSMAVLEGRVKPGDVTIPEKYRNVTETDLVWVIEKGENKRDFELKN